MPEKFSAVGGGLLHFSVYLSPLRGEMSRTKSTRQVLDMFLEIFLDIEMRQESRRGDRLRQYLINIKVNESLRGGKMHEKHREILIA